MLTSNSFSKVQQQNRHQNRELKREEHQEGVGGSVDIILSVLTSKPIIFIAFKDFHH